AILTQPLHDNYGGLLQAYALSKTLSKFGRVMVINRWRGHNSRVKRIVSNVKRMLFPQPNILTGDQKKIISQHTHAFRNKYIPNLSHKITTDRGMEELCELGFDTYVVGSDQCWRPKYSPNIYNYFLDFIQERDRKSTRLN